MLNQKLIDKLSEIELVQANTKHPKEFASNHEAYSVILEELDEVQDEIKRFEAKLKYLWYCIKIDDFMDAEDIMIDMKDNAYHIVAEALQVHAMCEKGIASSVAREMRK